MFHPVSTELVAGCMGIGQDRVLLFSLRDVMISIKLMYINHEISLGVGFSKTSRIALHRFGFGIRHFRPFPAKWRVGQDYFLVLVFAATRSELALRSGCPNRNGKCRNFRCICQNQKK